jgi:hypothetical protein
MLADGHLGCVEQLSSLLPGIMDSIENLPTLSEL